MSRRDWLVHGPQVSQWWGKKAEMEEEHGSEVWGNTTTNGGV